MELIEGQQNGWCGRGGGWKWMRMSKRICGGSIPWARIDLNQIEEARDAVTALNIMPLARQALPPPKAAE